MCVLYSCHYYARPALPSAFLYPLPLTIATKYEYAHIELTSQLTSVLVVFSAAGKQLGSEVSTLQITFLALSECGGLGTGTVFGLEHIGDFNS